MKNNKLFFTLLMGFTGVINIYSQVGINTATPHPSALLDIGSIDKGFLINKVPLQSRNDITTISNPKRGTLIIASTTVGSGNTQITAGTLYKFDGTQWQELLENNTNSQGFLYPSVVAIGKKTTTDTSCTGITAANFALTSLNSVDGSTISSTGALTAGRSGYYYWSINIKQFMLRKAYNPAIYPGMLTYAFQLGSTGARGWQSNNFSGSVYLNQGQTSEGFTWDLGDNGTGTGTCVADDRIGEQQVVWIYMGE
ncbi:hypothetical protein GCM10023210_27070 [Chryseobacterium ginsengisoli]|uniref:DUF4430 domain-containing protein n=1 Tax=Chryseobacterium ginsengisoli TaxID=363853 RepID=A0ABP9MD10_9FLAO